MNKRTWFVRILTVVVLVTGVCGVPSLQAAEKKPSPGASQGGRLFGIVVARTDKDITIKAEGETEAKRQVTGKAKP